MKPSTLPAIAGRSVLCFAVGLALAGCVGDGSTDLGDDVSRQPLRLLFPQRNVVVTPAIESFPVFLAGGAPGETVWLRIGDRIAEPFEISGPTTRLDIAIEQDTRRVSIVDSEFTPLATFGVEVVSHEAADGLLRQRKQEDEGGGAGEPGAGALDLLPLPILPINAEIYLDDEPPYFFTTYDLFCLTDVDVHRPISQDPAEPLVPEIRDFGHGAWTLRNDDADWTIGGNVASDRLPIAAVEDDIAKAPNANENDLVRVDAFNLLAIPDVYLFAFPVQAEADRNLGTPVRAVASGRQARRAELEGFLDASKSAAIPGFPVPLPVGTKTIWLEGRLGGRYRLVVGAVPPGTPPNSVKYNTQTNTTDPPLSCMRQASLTAAVVDIYQGNNSGRRRLTAFDVYWGARPHFLAEVWPDQGEYEWAAPYRRGAAVETVPGVAVTGDVAHMNRDRVEREPTNGASHAGHDVKARGQAGSGNKATIEGGIRVDRPMAGNAPRVNVRRGNRYPKRISVAYTVKGERLVRPEPLEVILPRLRNIPAAQLIEGTSRTVRSTVQYQIEDSFGRLILARNVDDYIDFYGAGLKAWEALGTDANTQEGGRRNDNFTITTVGQGLRALRVQTAQRSQARVRADRMTTAAFTDTLTFNARGNQNQRFLDWRAWAGTGTAAGLAARRQAAAKRVRDYNQAAGNPTALAALQATDAANTTANAAFSIPQDVILQLRSGDDRDDLMVLDANTLAVFAPHFFENMPNASQLRPFHFHLRFTPGTRTSRLVGLNRRRAPP